MMHSLCSKKKYKNNNCKNDTDITPIAETNNYCNKKNSDTSLCEQLKEQANHYALQANCAKEQAINLEQQAQELKQEIECLYMQANEFWNEYDNLIKQYELYINKANCCLNQVINNNCYTNTCNYNHTCTCNTMNKCNSCNNKPIITCKKGGCCSNFSGK